METEQPSFSRRITELDGLRGVAILLIIFWHYVETGMIPRYLSAFGRLTWSGVDLFFVLSGFLIGGILLDARTSPNFFKTFYIRRFYRLIPLYAVLLVTLYIGLALVPENPNPALNWLFQHPLPVYVYSTLTQNFWPASYATGGPAWIGVTWSLALEEQFYLTLPFVIRFVKLSRLRYLLIFVILSAPVLRTLLYLYYPHGNWAAYILMPCRADALMLGVCAAMLVRSPVGWSYLIKHRRSVNIILGILFVGVFWAGHKKWMVVDTLPMSSIGHTWIALFYLFILLIAISQPAHLISRILRTRVLVKVGIIAYGLYLLHSPVLGLCYAVFRGHIPHPSDMGDALTTVLAFILILALAQASWLYFEKPLIKLGHKYRYRRTE